VYVRRYADYPGHLLIIEHQPENKFEGGQSLTHIASREACKRATGPICRIDVTAFLSIQLALLFAFMGIVAGSPDLPKHAVDLPKANHAVEMRGADREDSLVVAIERNGDVFLMGDRVSPDQLPLQIRSAISKGSERKIYIRTDARAKYGRVIEVLKSVQSTGIENIGFMTDDRKLPLIR
jgi:biopolymer transport protein ExbD/biopolymer transport protein TolR